LSVPPDKQKNILLCVLRDSVVKGSIRMSNPIITLLTDFGLRDHYVASMKGVILSLNPHATLIDVTHQVTPQDIHEGGFILANAYPCFPKGTIHLAVVDPGVGGSRRPILLVTEDHFFVGPDNGLFTFVMQREKRTRILSLTNPAYFLPRVSDTFHGRDVFAPVAGYLSRGIKPEAFGSRLRSPVRIDLREPSVRGNALTGEVVHVDAFGNLISNISEEALRSFSGMRPVVVRIGRRTIGRVRKSYGDGTRGEVMALVGSGGFLEISIREGNARSALRMQKGEKVKVELIAHSCFTTPCLAIS
jgi:S-adenosylmethionine hydrolase